jgi:hypothetical protein
MQDQLRQIKRDVNGEMKGIRDDYRDRSAAAASITSAALSILGKRQKAGQGRADRKRQLRAERNTVLASYEALRTVIDRAIKELNGMKTGPERLIQQAEATGREGEKKAEAASDPLFLVHLSTPPPRSQMELSPPPATRNST